MISRLPRTSDALAGETLTEPRRLPNSRVMDWRRISRCPRRDWNSLTLGSEAPGRIIIVSQASKMLDRLRLIAELGDVLRRDDDSGPGGPGGG